MSPVCHFSAYATMSIRTNIILHIPRIISSNPHRLSGIIQPEEENLGVLVQQSYSVRVSVRIPSVFALKPTQLREDVPKPVDNEHGG